MAGAEKAAWLRLKQTDLIPSKGQFRSRFPQSAQLRLSDNDFSGYFGRSLWPGSERLRDNRRMMDAAHNQHSETRRPSDRDRIVTTGPSRFQPARPEVLR